MTISFTDEFHDYWIDQIIDLHNKTEMKRPLSMKAQLLRALKNRYAIISCWENEKIVGIGTMISDGEMYGSIFDVVVDPEFQGRGIGKQIIQRLVDKTPNACIHLTSTFGNEVFYKKVGFKKHKTAFARYPWESNYLED